MKIEKSNKKKIICLLTLLGIILVAFTSTASAAPTFTSSKNVLVINGYTGGTGTINSSDYLLGGPFNAGVVSMSQVNVASFSNVGNNDTVILLQVRTSGLTAAQKTTLVNFLTAGGKLIIWDSDAGALPTAPNDYSWLPTDLHFNTSVPGQLGARGGLLLITEENDLSSSDSIDPKYINTTRLINLTDAVGDANVVLTNGTDWCEDMFGENKATPPQSGPVHMYSRLAGSAGNGIAMYSALDWDYAGYSLPGGDELKKMLQYELMVSNTSDLPCRVPVVPEGNISGMKFNDLDRDGIKDALEPGLENWTITLTDPDGNTMSTVTDADGNYIFENLEEETYTIEEKQQLGWKQTYPEDGSHTIELSQGENIEDIDFGNFRIPPMAACIESVNPAGKKIPPAGKTTLPGSKGGQNEDGFYKLLARDILDPNLLIFVKDTGSGAIFGPFTNGTNIKYTESNGATPGQKKIGGPKSAVTTHITGNGDAAVYAINNAGIKSKEVLCLVPPPPK